MSSMSLNIMSFSPRQLFNGNEQGVWYDPSDFSTMFQDSAGTTPVTAVEQPVGLLLDKSQGLVLGPELLSNPSFDSSANYSLLAGATISGGQLFIDNQTNSRAEGLGNFIQAGVTVEVTIDVASTTGSVSVIIANSDGSLNINALSAGGAGIFTAKVFTQNTNGNFRIIRNTGASVVNSISFKVIGGNHATQATSASRPVLSARVNLLTYSEQFDNAAWTKTNTTVTAVTADATTDPNGNDTAYQLSTTAATTIFVIGQNLTVGAAVTELIYAKENTTGFLQLTFNGDTTSYFNFNLTSGVVGSSTGTVTGTIRSVGNGWHECIVNNSATNVTGITWGIVDSATATRRQTFAATGAESIYIWGADLRVANTGVGLPVYQRVGAATSGTSTAAGNSDYDTAGFPYYLRFDGIDDSLATSTITPGVDKAQMFAGASALAPRSNNSPVWQFGDAITSATDAFMRFLTGDGSTDGYRAYLSGTAVNQTPRVTKVVPYTSVFSNLFDAAETGSGEISVRENGTVTAIGSATDSGITSFGSQVLYIGKQGPVAVYLNGNLYSLIVRFGANLSTGQITDTEGWVNSRTRAY